MSVEQLTEQHLEFVSLTGGYTVLCQKCHIVGNHMSRLVLLIALSPVHIRGPRKFCKWGSNFDNVFFIFSLMREEGFKYHYK